MCQKSLKDLLFISPWDKKHKLLSEIIFWVLFLDVFHIPYYYWYFSFLIFFPFFVLYSKSDF